MRPPSGRLLLVALMAQGCIAACNAAPAGPGFTQQQAEHAALAMAGSASSTPVRLQTTELGKLRDFRGTSMPNLPGDESVWAVTVAGKYPSSGGGVGGPRTILYNSTQMVVLDATDGHFIFAETPAPSHP